MLAALPGQLGNLPLETVSSGLQAQLSASDREVTKFYPF